MEPTRLAMVVVFPMRAILAQGHQSHPAPLDPTNPASIRRTKRPADGGDQGPHPPESSGPQRRCPRPLPRTPGATTQLHPRRAPAAECSRRTTSI
uniref:Uncharacterized protein n=1 Tax=Triticum urartu TaxID=4572 RepID=A0A8R7TSC1_TRIUA